MDNEKLDGNINDDLRQEGIGTKFDSLECTSSQLCSSPLNRQIEGEEDQSREDPLGLDLEKYNQGNPNIEPTGESTTIGTTTHFNEDSGNPHILSSLSFEVNPSLNLNNQDSQDDGQRVNLTSGISDPPAGLNDDSGSLTVNDNIRLSSDNIDACELMGCTSESPSGEFEQVIINHEDDIEESCISDPHTEDNYENRSFATGSSMNLSEMQEGNIENVEVCGNYETKEFLKEESKTSEDTAKLISSTDEDLKAEIIDSLDHDSKPLEYNEGAINIEDIGQSVICNSPTIINNENISPTVNDSVRFTSEIQAQNNETHELLTSNYLEQDAINCDNIGEQGISDGSIISNYMKDGKCELVSTNVLENQIECEQETVKQLDEQLISDALTPILNEDNVCVTEESMSPQYEMQQMSFEDCGQSCTRLIKHSEYEQETESYENIGNSGISDPSISSNNENVSHTTDSCANLPEVHEGEVNNSITVDTIENVKFSDEEISEDPTLISSTEDASADFVPQAIPEENFKTESRESLNDDIKQQFESNLEVINIMDSEESRILDRSSSANNDTVNFASDCIVRSSEIQELNVEECELTNVTDEPEKNLEDEIIKQSEASIKIVQPSISNPLADIHNHQEEFEEPQTNTNEIILSEKGVIVLQNSPPQVKFSKGNENDSRSELCTISENNIHSDNENMTINDSLSKIVESPSETMIKESLSASKEIRDSTETKIDKSKQSRDGIDDKKALDGETAEVNFAKDKSASYNISLEDLDEFAKSLFSEETNEGDDKGVNIDFNSSDGEDISDQVCEKGEPIKICSSAEESGDEGRKSWSHSEAGKRKEIVFDLKSSNHTEISGSDIENGNFSQIIIIGDSYISDLAKSWPSSSNFKPYFIWKNSFSLQGLFRILVESTFLDKKKNPLVIILSSLDELLNYKTLNCKHNHAPIQFPLHPYNKKIIPYMIETMKHGLFNLSNLKKYKRFTFVFGAYPYSSLSHDYREGFNYDEKRRCKCYFPRVNQNIDQANKFLANTVHAINTGIYNRGFSAVYKYKNFRLPPFDVKYYNGSWSIIQSSLQRFTTNLHNHLQYCIWSDPSDQLILKPEFENSRAVKRLKDAPIFFIGNSWLKGVAKDWPFRSSLKPFIYTNKGLMLDDIKTFIMNEISTDEDVVVVATIGAEEFFDYMEYSGCLGHKPLIFPTLKNHIVKDDDKFVSEICDRLVSFITLMGTKRKKCKIVFTTCYPVILSDYYTYLLSQHKGHKFSTFEKKELLNTFSVDNKARKVFSAVNDLIFAINKANGLHTCDIYELLLQLKGQNNFTFPRFVPGESPSPFVSSKLTDLLYSYLESVDSLIQTENVNVHCPTEEVLSLEVNNVLGEVKLISNKEELKKLVITIHNNSPTDRSNKVDQLHFEDVDSSQEHHGTDRNYEKMQKDGHQDYKDENKMKSKIQVSEERSHSTTQYKDERRGIDTRQRPHDDHYRHSHSYDRTQHEDSRDRFRSDRSRESKRDSVYSRLDYNSHSSSSRSSRYRDHRRSRSRSRSRRRSRSPRYSKRRHSHSRRSPQRQMSVESIALSNLREIHERECHLYRQNPMAHPDYNKEYRIWSQSVVMRGFDPSHPEMWHEWTNLWNNKMDHLFEMTWQEKKSNCLSLLPAGARNQSRGGSSRHSRSPESKKYKRSKGGSSKRSRKRSRRSNSNSSSSSDSGDGSVEAINKLQKKIDKFLETATTANFPQASTIRVEPDIIKDEISKPVEPQFESSHLNAKLKVLIQILSRIADKFGILSMSIQELDQKVMACSSRGKDALDCIDEDVLILFGMLNDKLDNILTNPDLTLVQKAIYAEAKEKISTFLESFRREKDSSYFGLNIIQIAKSTVGLDPSRIIAFIKNSLKYNHVNNPSDEDLMRIYTAVKSKQITELAGFSKASHGGGSSLPTSSATPKSALPFPPPKAPSMKRTSQTFGSSRPSSLGGQMAPSTSFVSNKSGFYNAAPVSKPTSRLTHPLAGFSLPKKDKIRQEFMNLSMASKVKKFANFTNLEFEEKNFLISHLQELEQTDESLAASLRSLITSRGRSNR